jgi:hypothetical protein
VFLDAISFECCVWNILWREHSMGAIRRIMVDMANAAYISTVRIERIKGPLRRAWLPTEKDPVLFGVHGAVAEHYRVAPEVLEPHATTLDYIVAAAAG